MVGVWEVHSLPKIIGMCHPGKETEFNIGREGIYLEHKREGFT